MAGTIKLVTNQPDTSGTYGEVGVELNNVAHGDFGGVVEGFINAPLGERAALRLVGWYRHDAGYIDNIAGSRTYPIKQFVGDDLVDLPGDDIVQTNAGLVEKNYNDARSEEHTSELQSLMRHSYAVFRLKKKHKTQKQT